MELVSLRCHTYDHCVDRLSPFDEALLKLLEVVEQVVQVKDLLQVLRQVQPILVAVEVVVKTCQTLLKEVVVEWLLLEDQVQ